MKSVVVAALLAMSPFGEADQSLSAIQFRQCPSGCVLRCTMRVPKTSLYPYNPRAGRCYGWDCICPRIDPRMKQPNVKRPVIRR